MVALGPGLLFAAAAVGVSHLVQSTRAGAEFGLGLLAAVVVANLVKYPAFRFGPEYAVATRTSLLDGYRRQGGWALVLYGGVTVGTMFTVQAAVTVVTAGLAITAFELSGGVFGWSVALLVGSVLLLFLGHYRALDRVTKVLVAILTVSTLVAAAAALPRVELSSIVPSRTLLAEPRALFFMAALVGWMPTAVDVAVWQGLWTLARAEDTGRLCTPEESRFDFHVGYFGSAFLALCFVVMGAGILHPAGAVLSDSPAGFAAQVVELYTATLGSWIGPVVGVGAFAVMLSTTLTCLDGFSRALAALAATARGRSIGANQRDPFYWLCVGSLLVGALVVIGLLLGSLRMLVDLATTLSFLTAPLLSWLNHRAMHGEEVPPTLRPRPWLRWASVMGIGVQSAFAFGYLFLRYG